MLCGSYKGAKGIFPLFWRVVKSEIPTDRNSLIMEKCREFGVNFGASKLEKTLSRFFWIFDKDIISKFA